MQTKPKPPWWCAVGDVPEVPKVPPRCLDLQYEHHTLAPGALHDHKVRHHAHRAQNAG